MSTNMSTLDGMATRAHSSDPRAERVRTLLRDAAFGLAHERQVNGLTVNDIVTRAGVSRQAFYLHFRDRDDAVAAAVTVAFTTATADGGANPRDRIVRLFAFAAEHRALYRNIIPSAVTERVVAAFRAELASPCEQIARQSMPVIAPIAALSPESVSRFLVGGFMEVLRSWMDDPDAEDLQGRVTAALDTVTALLGLSVSVHQS